VAGAEMRAKVAEAEAERVIAQTRNDVRRVAAELEAEAKSAEERAEANALAAQATSMQGLEAVRRELEAVRLQADVVIPAEVAREASELAAAGAAASIAENGRATAESLALVAEAWRKAGPSAEDMFLLNKIEDITTVVVEAVRRIELGEVEIVDTDGQALPRLAAAYPAAVAAVLQSLLATTGVDIGAVLTRQRGNGIGGEVRP
jgi:flotillin